jgi:coenzyme F420-0:L-glutamate ligase / coenzyme F420-1:gamma-L-glutamate ligase
MAPVSVSATLSLRALADFPRVQRGDDVGQLIEACLARSGLELAPCDVLVVTSKVCSRAEGRYVDLAGVTPGPQACALAREVDRDPRLVELVLRESAAVSRKAPGVLIVRHRLGFVAANAGIDLSNAAPASAEPGAGPFALLLPSDPDAAARQIRARLEASAGCVLGVVISDSQGRPFRLGTLGAAIGLSGLPALFTQVGRSDLDGRVLEATVTALADQVAAAADLVAGQADEGRAVVLVRGLSFAPLASGASELLRPERQDLYA